MGCKKKKRVAQTTKEKLIKEWKTWGMPDFDGLKAFWWANRPKVLYNFCLGFERVCLRIGLQALISGSVSSIVFFVSLLSQSMAYWRSSNLRLPGAASTSSSPWSRRRWLYKGTISVFNALRFQVCACFYLFWFYVLLSMRGVKRGRKILPLERRRRRTVAS